MHAEHSTPRRPLRSRLPRGSHLGPLALLTALVAGGLATPDARAMEVYVEYSNETWNYGFEQADYCRQQGVALGLDGAEYRAGFEFHVYAAIRLFERFEEVWGKDNPRLVSELANPNLPDGIDDPGDPTGSDDPAISEDPDDTLAGGCSLLAARAGTGASALIFLLVLAHALWQAWRSRRRPRSM